MLGFWRHDLTKFLVERFRVIVRLMFSSELLEALVLRLVLNLAAGRLTSRCLPRRPRFRSCHQTGASIASAPYMACLAREV
jgi:hypothetical protein